MPKIFLSKAQKTDKCNEAYLNMLALFFYIVKLI